MFGKKKDRQKFNPSPGLVSLSYRLLLEDRAMVGVLAVGAAAATAVLAAILIPATVIGHITPLPNSGGLSGLVVYALALWAMGFVSTLSTGVVVAAAQIRCEGGRADVRAALGTAWSRREQLAAWAAIGVIVSLVMQLLQRLGLAGVIMRVLAGVTWSVATVFAVPVIISEGTMPVQTVKRSASVVRTHFGSVVRSSIRLALPWMLAMSGAAMVAGVGGASFVYGISSDVPAAAVVGGLAMVTGALGFLFCAFVSSALSAYLDTLLYRYGLGLPVPPIAPYDLPPIPSPI